MELITKSKVSDREAQIVNWLTNHCNFPAPCLHPLVHDASFRRYFRLFDNNHSYIVMDAPPPEKCQPFVTLAKKFNASGLRAPDILFSNIHDGFLVLTDFGDSTYLSALNTQTADRLYLQALDALSKIQSLRGDVPPFTGQFMQQEWLWHQEWFLQKFLGMQIVPELNECYDFIVKSAVEQPQVFMHRDFHSANLMVLDNGPGILDFQDAFIGPVTYDLASLLRDCYIDWPLQKTQHWVSYYWQLLTRLKVINVSQDEFLRWFDLMGLQRHLKALMTFARKKVRDHQPKYLAHVPRTLNYIVTVSGHYPELKALNDFYKRIIFPCAQ